ncbi:MAG: VWA domain-containing protein [Deltaproteobacteria bacterium]|nr:VWA domain-containing protein [Deltaproteobacteria bacterium]
MRFASPLLLALLGLVPVFVALWLRDARARPRRLAALVDAGLLPTVTLGVSLPRRAWRRGLALLAFALVVVSAAGPQWGSSTVLLPHKGLDVLFVLDVSRSMRARDVLPDRLERAKAEIGAFLPRLAEHRVGVVAFAGTAFVQCPLTTDAEAVRLFLRGLVPESVPQGGTALAAGLTVAVNALRAEAEAQAGSTGGPGARSAGRVVVVVTDGEDHDGGLDEVARALKEEGVTVVLVGVGSTLGEPIPLLDEAGASRGYLRDRAGQTVMSRMSPELLAKVAEQVGGVFVDGTNAADLGLREVESRIAALEKRDLETRVRTEHTDRSALAAGVALLCLLGSLLLAERRRGGA